MIKRIGAATAILALIAGAVTFTNTFVTRTVLASEIQQVYQTMEIRDIERAQRDLYSKHLQLKTVLYQTQNPQLRDSIIHDMNELEDQRQLLDKEMMELLKRPTGDR